MSPDYKMLQRDDLYQILISIQYVCYSAMIDISTTYSWILCLLTHHHVWLHVWLPFTEPPSGSNYNYTSYLSSSLAETMRFHTRINVREKDCSANPHLFQWTPTKILQILWSVNLEELHFGVVNAQIWSV